MLTRVVAAQPLDGVRDRAGLRIFRVARNLRIPAGTTEIQRDLIARSL